MSTELLIAGVAVTAYLMGRARPVDRFLKWNRHEFLNGRRGSRKRTAHYLLWATLHPVEHYRARRREPLPVIDVPRPIGREMKGA